MGILGGVAGSLAQRNKGRSIVIGCFYTSVCVGVLFLVTGIVALLFSQPYSIWFPFVLSGTIFSVVTLGVLPAVKRAYAEAESRRLAAEELRQS